MNPVTSILLKICRAINYLTPKNNKKVIFASTPDFSDNAWALYDYMSKDEFFINWKFVWVVDKSFNPPIDEKAIFLTNPSGRLSFEYFKYLYHLFTSKYLFCTHTSFAEAVPVRQVSVLLWHGTMLKKVGGMNDNEKSFARKNQFRYFISASEYYKKYFSQCFLCSYNQVIACGYPRNDLLFQDCQLLEKLGVDSKLFKKIIVYMPTFRNTANSKHNDIEDGMKMCFDMSDIDKINEISSFLRNRSILLIIKWHPADVRQSIPMQTENIISVRNKDIEDVGGQVYHLLNKADALITDYSGVFCDYLLLNRPIAFDLTDFKSYSENRGMIFENPLDYMPGYKLYNEADFKSFCTEISNDIDSTKEDRVKLGHIYNDYLDSNNCYRLLKSLKIL